MKQVYQPRFTYEVLTRLPHRIIILCREGELVPCGNIEIQSQEELDFWLTQIQKWRDEIGKCV